MTKNKHNSENRGSKLRDHARPRPHFLTRAHRDWRVWLVVMLMLLSMVIYVLSEDETWRPGSTTNQPMPADMVP